ncbi:MAG: hypothetical protein MK207_05265 [Saprospiraceae bacterium]|nr:hypothetical protein [Saprospiraceae bacterium]
MSKYFSNRALKSLNIFGNLLMPETEHLPSFTQTGCLVHIDSLAEHAPEDDISALNIALVLLSFMPLFFFKWLIKKMKRAQETNGMMSTIYRQLNFGITGLLYSLYYSGKSGENYKGKPIPELIGNDSVRKYD